MNNIFTYPETTSSKIRSLLILFLALQFIAQLLSEPFPIGSILAFVGGVVILLIVLVLGNRNDMFLFLFIITAMNIVIPYGKQRELELFAPSLFFVVAIFRFFPKFSHLKKRYLHSLVLCLGVFFVFCMVGIFNQIKIPGINASIIENSGLLNRFNLFNSVIIFVSGLILFDFRFIEQFISYFFVFYLIVFLVSIVIILFELGAFPFFNTFSWTLIIENQQSKKMVIAGVASSFVLTYALVFLRSHKIFYPLVFSSIVGILISGSRTFFAVALFIFFVLFTIRRKVFGKSLLFLTMGIILSVYLLLSPLVLLVPEKYQRLVIIFPPEYYTGELAEMAESAAASSTRFRIKIWSMASEKIMQNPIFGNSFGTPKGDYNFEGNPLEGFQRMPEKILYQDFMVTGSLHNTFFSIAYLLGIPALFFFIFFFTRLIWIHYRYSLIMNDKRKNVAIFIMVILIHYFISALAGDIIFDLTFFLFLAIALKIFLFYYDQPLKQNFGT